MTVVRQVRMYCGQSVKVKIVKRRTFAFVFTCVVGKNPNWSSMADDAITRGGIGIISFLYLWVFIISVSQRPIRGYNQLCMGEIILVRFSGNKDKWDQRITYKL